MAKPTVDLNISAPRLQSKPTPVCETGVSAPSNPEIRRAAEDVLNATRYAFAAGVVATSRKTRADSLERLFSQAVDALPEERRKKFQTRARALVQATPEVRSTVFGRYGVLDADDILGVGAFGAHAKVGTLELDREALGMKVPTVTLDPTKLNLEKDRLVLPTAALPGMTALRKESVAAALARRAAVAAGNAEEAVDVERLRALYGLPAEMVEEDVPEELEGQQVLSKLKVEILRVKCIKETSPSWWGSDEIAMAGVSIDENGDTKQIDEWYVGGGFDGGDSKTYSYPGREMHLFSVLEGKSWPKTYRITMLMAEKDNGGFSSIVSTLYARIREKVKEVIGDVVGSFLEAYLGAWLGQVIGEAVAWVVDQLFGWIVSAFADDVMAPVNVSMRHVALGARWTINGTWGWPFSPWFKAYFNGHGGRYEVTYRWRLLA